MLPYVEVGSAPGGPLKDAKIDERSTTSYVVVFRLAAHLVC